MRNFYLGFPYLFRKNGGLLSKLTTWGKKHFSSCAEVVFKDKLNCLHQVATVNI